VIWRTLLRGLALGLAVLTAVPVAALVLGTSAEAVLAAAQDAEVLAAAGWSLACAAMAVAVGLLLGVPAGYLLARGRLPGAALWSACVELPLLLPHPVLGLGLLTVFARRRLLGAALYESWGLEVAGAAPGIVLAMVIVSAPFIVKAAREGFAAVPVRLEQVAWSLGASDARTFLTVALPLARPSIAAGAQLAWARAVSEFGSVVILAYHPKTAPVLVWDRFSTGGIAAALPPAVLLLGVCGAASWLLRTAPGGRR
jgi:molybdate/tungstate transport system permease protein